MVRVSLYYELLAGAVFAYIITTKFYVLEPLRHHAPNVLVSHVGVQLNMYHSGLIAQWGDPQ